MFIYTVESSAVKKEPGPRTKTLVSGNGSHIVATTGTPAVPITSIAGGQFYFETPNQTATGTDSIEVSDAFNLVKNCRFRTTIYSCNKYNDDSNC